MILPKFRYYAYCHPFKFFYIGWIVRKADSMRAYVDSDPEDFVMSDSEVVYLCFGLTRDSVMKKFKKYIDKHVL